LRTEHDWIRANARLFQISFAMDDGELETVVAAGREALEALPEGTDFAAFARGAVHYFLAQAYSGLGDAEAAERALAQAQQSSLGAEGHTIALAVAATQAEEAWARGDLHAVARICREAIASLIQPAEDAGERLPYACFIYARLGSTLVEWNELEEAVPLLVRGAEGAKRVLHWELEVDACCDLALLYRVQRRYQAAHAWMDKAQDAYQGDPDDLHPLRVCIWLAQGEDPARTQAEEEPRWLDAAIRWADGCVLEDRGEYSHLESLIRVRIAQYRAYGEPDLAPVLSAINGYLAALASIPEAWQVSAWVLKALLFQALGQTEEALAPLARALEIAQATGQVIAFLEHGPLMAELLREATRQNVAPGHARQFLAAFEACDPAAQSPL
jgi:tetratricopeptide (TPR) repeat protein